MMSLKGGEGESDALLQPSKLAAVEAAAELSDPRLRAKLKELVKSEGDLKVRDAAMQALKR
jgi:hypothetical protein